MKSEDLVPGSQEWHLAVSEELIEESKTLQGEEKKYMLELAEFHKLIGMNQPKAGK